MNKKIAFGGLLTALSVVMLYLAATLPSGKLALYCIAGLPIAVMQMEFGLKASLTVYLASGILFSVLSGQLKVGLLYLAFVGIYPIVKYFAECTHHLIREVSVKFAFLNFSVVVILLCLNALGLPIEGTISTIAKVFHLDSNKFWVLGLLFVLLQVLFFAYDFAFSLALKYYQDVIRKVLPMRD